MTISNTTAPATTPAFPDLSNISRQSSPRRMATAKSAIDKPILHAVHLSPKFRFITRKDVSGTTAIVVPETSYLDGIRKGYWRVEFTRTETTRPTAKNMDTTEWSTLRTARYQKGQNSYNHKSSTSFSRY